VTRNPQTARQIHLHRGCYPFVYDKPQSTLVNTSDAFLSPAESAPWQEDVDSRIRFGMEQGVKYGLLKHGDMVVAVQGWKGGLGNTNTLRILSTP